MDRSTKLTEHFRLCEFIRDEDPLPPLEIMKNLRTLATRLEGVRSFLGDHHIVISSGYRTKKHNAEVGGQPNSFHLRGMAADFTVVGMTPRQVQSRLRAWSGGMGCYPNFTHLDIRPYKARWGV